VHSISERQALRVKLYVADCTLGTQEKRIGDLCKICLQTPPDWAMSRLSWDETGERLTLNVDDGDAAEPLATQRSTWQVLVARIRVIVGWVRGGADNAQVIDWTFVVPPLVIRTTLAANIYYALHHCLLTRPLMMARFLILQSARSWSFDLSETDAATASWRRSCCPGRSARQLPDRARR
jgi:hypothetical protein